MKRIRRILIRVVLMVVVPVIALWIAVEAYLAGGQYVTAENAYVKTDIVNIGSEVDGRVVRVFVNDYDTVQVAQLLFEIDPEPFGIAIAMAEAEMAMVRQEVAALRALYRQGEAEIRAAEEDIRYFIGEFERQQELVAQGAGTQSKMDAAEHEVAAAQRDFAVLREQNAVVLADLGGSLESPIENQPMYRVAEAMRRDAALDLSRTLVTAPMDGTLSQVLLEVGEYIEAGDPVFALVATSDPWIEVNLKEVDLTHILVGQKATVVVDAYPDVVWPAVVDSISPATGAEFALLPPQNSTGNWVKVVQRVPVRLRLQGEGDTSALRSGMTVTVSIDTGQERTFDGLVDGVLADVLPGQ
ncbi:MAG: HlyD family secretion protein [Alphaproteobacteria bacterium]|jgi:membrane fusion protein, multidrug efflux system|nr:HlyD family secretion protein [Rhodospirillaceae bacterium]MDG2480458.1 HlyD family secretion protein [Alphaproteobacteria bacterium]MBT6205991.1 HlyD family secretion protein [Rhodospirillaceae bacterium]MBT6512075.1 HlyD family secretion protein [Rhodospirillaceae bacterium]MBT7615426.1 HlyD family secretion protein [Rhodospirillaceae bacterium]